LIWFVFLILFSPPAAGAAGEDGPVIKLIEIRGNKQIETDTIEAKITSELGGVLLQKDIQNDIKILYGLGYFDDVRVEVEPFEGGVKLMYVLKEKPSVISVDFQGNEKIKTDELMENTTLTPGSIANQTLIMDNVVTIETYYQSKGFRFVNVIPVIREVSEAAVAVTFLVDEGREVKIKEVSIEGNKSIASKELKKAMKTRKRWIFSFITGSGYYNEDVMSADMERIRTIYHSKGYIHVKISEPEITFSPDRKNLFVKISLTEGEQYRVGDISFSGNSIFGSTALYGHTETLSGNVFNRTALRGDIDSILGLYTEKGYAMADVSPLIDVNTESRIVNITFSINEGDIFKIGHIRISGNNKTRDNVIRREVRLDEGDIYNSKLLKRSYQRITNLNFFDSIEINPRPVIREKLIDLDVKVKEKLTGMLTVGGGYSSVDKFIVTGEITQTNLFGKGLYLKLKADLSGIRANYNLKLTDPWFMDKPVSASLGLFNEVFEYPDYDKKATGGSIGFGKELSEYVRGNITYKLEDVRISDVAEEASSIIKEQEGKRLTSSISPSLWKDTRNNYLDPTSGSKNAIYATYSGIGGDNYFVKVLLDSLWYFPYKWDTAFSFRSRFGYASGFGGKALPLYERFYVGGIDTVRGLGFGEGGPRDEDTDEIIGGTKELIFNAEYIFPLEENIRLKGVVFFDYGQAFDENEDITSLRPTTGFGLRWLSPFGPIRLEWGFNISKRENESSSKIEFALGGIF
jgi:outer membrane protein insertion porin family